MKEYIAMQTLWKGTWESQWQGEWRLKNREKKRVVAFLSLWLASVSKDEEKTQKAEKSSRNDWKAWMSAGSPRMLDCFFSDDTQGVETAVSVLRILKKEGRYFLALSASV